MQKKSNCKNKGPLSKWYYLCLYSFDHEHLVRGPFESEKKCWETMRKEAKEEYRIDLKENVRISEVIVAGMRFAKVILLTLGIQAKVTQQSILLVISGATTQMRIVQR